MLNKLMMLLSGKSLKEKFTIKPYQSFSTPEGAYSLTSSLSPESEAFTKIMSEYQYNSMFPDARPYATIVFSPTKLFDSIVVTRLDTGKRIGLTWTSEVYSYEISKDPHSPAYSGYQTKTDNDPSGLLFTKADIGKTIEITIEPGGGLIGFFRRFVTFLRGGLRNAKKNDANEKHPIANWSRGICDYSSSYREYWSRPCYWLSKFLGENRQSCSRTISRRWRFSSFFRHRNHGELWYKSSVSYIKKLFEILYPKDGYLNNAKIGFRKQIWEFCYIGKSAKFIFRGRCRQRNPFINPWRVASSALCAGGCHA